METSSGTIAPLAHVDQKRAFQDEDIWRPVKYKGKTVPFAVAKMDMWKNDIRLWAKEQVFTKDESDGLAKHFPAHLDYFWDILDLIEKFGICIVPKTRRMMMTHLFLSVKMAHNLLFMKNSYNCIITLREGTAKDHLRDRTLFTLQHLDYRFPYPKLGTKEGIEVTAETLKNNINGATVNAYPSGSGKVRGMTVTFGFYDEYAHQTNQKENWEAVLPALEGALCRGVFVSSVEAGSFMEELCTDIPEKSPYVNIRRGLSYTLNSTGACLIHLNYKADPRKDPATEEGKEWFRRERKKYDKYTWLKEMEGLWRFPIQGRVFHQYQKDQNSINWEERSSLPPDSPIHIGFDPGFRFPAVVISWVNSLGELCVDQCIMRQNVDIEDFFNYTVFPYLDEKFHFRWKGRDRWYIDPAGKVRGSSQGTKAAKKVLRSLLKHRRIYHEHTFVEDRIRMVNILFKRRKIRVNPNAGIFYPEDKKAMFGTFVDMLEWGYQHAPPKDEGKYQDTKPNKDDFFDHMADAFGYIIAVIFKDDIDNIKNNRLKKPSSKDRSKVNSMPWAFAKADKQVKSKNRYAQKVKPFL